MFNFFCKSTSIRNWHWKVMWHETIAQSLCFYYILNFTIYFYIYSRIMEGKYVQDFEFCMHFTRIQMMIPNQAKCNDYSICIHMKKFWKKKRINFESFYLTYSKPHEWLQVLIIFFTFKCWQKWFIFLCNSWVYITS
jgi:hypothetical protein